MSEPEEITEDEPYDWSDLADPDFDRHCCYECGGRGWIVTCPEDLCHGPDECIYGDGKDACPACNKNGEIEEYL